MSLYIAVKNTTTRKIKYVPYPGFTLISDFLENDVQDVFPLGMDIDVDHYIEAYVSGSLMVDGVHFNRDTVNNTITFTKPVDVGNRVDIKVYYK